MPSNTTNRPNIVLIFADQQHYEALGRQEPHFTTPCLDAFANEATRFTHTYCTTPQCSPSRASLVTGQYPHRTGVLNNVRQPGGGPLTEPTFAKPLKDAGYRTGWFGKWHLDEHEVPRQGFDVWRDTHNDSALAKGAINFLHEAAQGDDPFALVVSIFNPHDIYHYSGHETDPSAIDADADAKLLPRSWHEENFENKPELQQQFMTDDQGKFIVDRPAHAWADYRRWYAEMTRRYDTEAGRVIDALKEAGVWDDSIVIVTSDHGDMDTHHRLVFKGPFMYEQLARVPLMIRVPEKHAGQSPRDIDEFAILPDLYTTILDFAGCTPPSPRDGQSLKPVLTGAGPMPQRDFVIGQYYGKQKWVNPMRMIRNATMKYIKTLNAGCELYDLAKDPDELHNRADDPAYADALTDLRQQLREWIEANDDPFYTQQPTTREGEPVQLQ